MSESIASRERHDELAEELRGIARELATLTLKRMLGKLTEEASVEVERAVGRAVLIALDGCCVSTTMSALAIACAGKSTASSSLEDKSAWMDRAQRLHMLGESNAELARELERRSRS